MMGSLTNFFERLEQHQAAQKALEMAKANEQAKIAKGHRYVKQDHKTWVLKKN